MKEIKVIMYHYIRPIKNGKFKGLKGLEVKEFDNQIKFLNENYNIISYDDFCSKLLNNNIQGDEVLLTFDDGYIDHYTYAFPILKKFNVSGVFFVNSLPDENVVMDVNKIQLIFGYYDYDMTKIKSVFLKEFSDIDSNFDANSILELKKKWYLPNKFDNANIIFWKRLLQVGLKKEIRNLALKNVFNKIFGDEKDVAKDFYLNIKHIKEMYSNGMSFGLHTHSHVFLGELKDISNIKDEIVKNINYLNEYINMNYLSINYPYGNYDSYVLDVAKSLGIKIGFTTEWGGVTIKSDLLTLPRYDTNDFTKV